MWDVILFLAIILLVYFILRKNDEAGIYTGWIGLGIVILAFVLYALGFVLYSDIALILGCTILLASWYFAQKKLKSKETYGSTKSSTYTPTSYSISSYQSVSLRQKADAARIHMNNVYEYYQKAKDELTALEQQRNTMDPKVYAQKHQAQSVIVADRKRNFDAAAEAYRQAELEAP